MAAFTWRNRGHILPAAGNWGSAMEWNMIERKWYEMTLRLQAMPAVAAKVVAARDLIADVVQQDLKPQVSVSVDGTDIRASV